jgi:hypothetical protein
MLAGENYVNLAKIKDLHWTYFERSHLKSPVKLKIGSKSLGRCVSREAREQRRKMERRRIGL